MTGFRFHNHALGHRLGPSGLAARYREVSEPTKEVAKLDPAGAIEEEAVALNKTGRTPKTHIGFRLSEDVVADLKASGPGYNRRVEQALRQAGFGAAKKAKAKKATAKRAPPAKRRA